jgi:hypothetical protein
MSPFRQLNALQLAKDAVVARIDRERDVCVRHGARLLAPLVTLDAVWASWRRLSPLVRSVGVTAGALLAWRARRTAGDPAGSGLRRIVEWVRLARVLFATAKGVPRDD